MTALNYLSLVSMMIMISISHGFSSVPNHHTVGLLGRTGPRSRPLETTRLGVFALDGAFSAMDTFFQTEPYVAAFLTCSAKASAADWVAQSQSTQSEGERINLPRNLAFILYGGFYQGCVQAFIYAVLFPAWFPDPSAQTILSQVAIDLLVLGPMIAMPTVYTMKALLAGEEDPMAGIKKYWDHVQNKGILFKYWAIWGPVQTLNFGLVPHHLRVVFVAMFSFFWICLLSTVSSETEEGSNTIAPSSATNYHPHHQYPSSFPQAQAVPIRVLADAFEASQREEQRLARITSL